MSIRVVCPNGHVLNIKDKYAGKAGLCPVCKARVDVPVPQTDIFTEDSIMDVLQPSESGLSLDAANCEIDSGDPWSSKPDMGMRICSKCFKEIAIDARICPFCNTYVHGARSAVHSNPLD